MKNSKASSAIAVLLIIVGVMSLIFGIIVLTMENGSTGSSATFGADFYNYVNNNAARSATNVRNLTSVVKLGFGFGLIIAGLITALSAAYKLASKQRETYVPKAGQYHTEPAPEAAPAVNVDELPEL